MWKPNRTPVLTENAPPPAPFLSQAIVAGNMIYCSGQVGVNPSTGKMVEGSVQERTVRSLFQSCSCS
jgi:enamine deaminase RidA (YjgF/YER057c/UK114 family)